MTPIEILKFALYTRITQLNRIEVEECIERCLMGSTKINSEIREIEKAIAILEREVKC